MIEAIAKESSISKGGVMHQFGTKDVVVEALIARQAAQLETAARDCVATDGVHHTQPRLTGQIAISRAAISGEDYPLTFGLLAQDPELLAITHSKDVETMTAIGNEAPDPDLAMLRWLVARGLAQLALAGPNPLPDDECERLSARLLDNSYWKSLPARAAA
jgi:AcrR family transcriptional regulator